MSLISYWIVLLFLFQSTQNLRTTQPTNYLREGPGSYFNIIGSLPSGISVNLVEKKGSWMRVKVENETGWISENSFTQKLSNRNEEMTKGKSSSRASRAELAAAVKGFAKKYVAGNESSNEDISKYTSSSGTVDEMEKFEHSFTVEPFRGYMNIERPFDMQFHEEAIGLGIAQKIARQKGIVDNPRATLYINLIGNYISKYTKAYDLGFRFFILNDNHASAFACPGGYIFISKGMLSLCENEAELAAVLAHEMTHVIQRHGLKELKLSEPKIKSEKAFAELEEETGEEKSEEEKDLDSYADNAYDNIIAPRLIQYELDGDRLAVLYLKRAGYDPTSFVSLLQKLQSMTQQRPDIFDDNYTRKDDMNERLVKAQYIVRSEGYRSNREKLYTNRFQNYVDGLR